RTRAGAHAVAAALGAGVLDDPAGAAAVAARLGERERTLAGADEARARARRADVRAGARPSARAAAGLAAAGRRQPDRHLGAADGVDEVDRQLGLDVGAPTAARGRGGACAPTTATAAEQAAEEVAEPARAARLAACARVAEQVVQVE